MACHFSFNLSSSNNRRVDVWLISKQRNTCSYAQIITASFKCSVASVFRKKKTSLSLSWKPLTKNNGRIKIYLSHHSHHDVVIITIASFMLYVNYEYCAQRQAAALSYMYLVFFSFSISDKEYLMIVIQNPSSQ